MFDTNRDQKTLRDGAGFGALEHTNRGSTFFEGLALKSWRGFRVVQEFPAEGGEADLFIAKKDGRRYVLKLYREGMEPKETVLSKIKKLSETPIEYVVRVFEHGYDNDLGRWYELQEYAMHGNLKDYMKSHKLTDREIRDIIHELKVLKTGRSLG